MAERFEIGQTALPGVQILTRKPRYDERGFLERVFDFADFQGTGWPGQVMQVNHTVTKLEGTVRGLHFQFVPGMEWKYVTCIKGSVCDVAVDLRADSPTYLQHFALVLDSREFSSLLIPPGCAHGFQTLEPDTEMIYLHSELFQPDRDAGINPFDPRLAIHWPKLVRMISEKDKSLPNIDASFKGVVL